MRPALPFVCALVVLGWLTPTRCGAQAVPFGVGMSWTGECSQPGVPGGVPPVTVSDGSGLLAQPAFVAPAIAADCPGACAPPPFPPDLCTGSRWDGTGSVGLGAIDVHSRAWSAAGLTLGEYLAAGTISGQWLDTVYVASDSLPAGSPVKLRFEIALSSTAIPVRTPGTPCIAPVLAKVVVNFLAETTSASSGGSTLLENSCRGTTSEVAAFVVDTAVGESFRVHGFLSAEAHSWAATEFIDEMTATADATIDGGLTSHFRIDAFTAAASYTTASGVDYASPVPPPPCGNGLLDGGEACDDGNLRDGDCCSSVCQVEAAATVCRDAVDACDVAETCDGESGACPVDARLPDADADGVCDTLDLCANVGGAQDLHATRAPILRLTNVNVDSQAGNDTLASRAELDLPPGSAFADLDPGADALRLVVMNGLGTALIDAALPGGAHAGPGTRGWRSAAGGRRWIYTDHTTEPIGAITKARLVARDGADGRRMRVVIRGAGGTYGVSATDLPLHVLVLLGGSSDRCGERRFQPGGCQVSSNGKRLVCRD